MLPKNDAGTTCAKNSKRNQSYSDKLKSPKWQKKRLEILSKRGFKCEVCGDEENQIQVHHKTYMYGLEPWQYDDSVYQVLCEKCHIKAHKKEDILRGNIPHQYRDFVEHCEVNDDGNVSNFLFYTKDIIGSEHMVDFVYILHHVHKRGFNSVFDDLIKTLSKHDEEMNLYLSIQELRSKIKYLEDKTGFCEPEFEFPF